MSNLICSIKNRSCFTILFFFIAVFSLSAFGKGELQEKKLNNLEWTLCITDFNVEGLPVTQSAIGVVVEKKLVDYFNGLDYKLRNIKEYDYYWNVLWMKSQNEVAKKIASKQADRDKLLFAGYANWRYKREIKKLNKEIEALQIELEDAELSDPALSILPRFTVSPDNLAGVFPQPPLKHGEYFFCQDKKADGFLQGKVSIYHERILVELSMWTVWTRSYSYTDTIIFSIEDIDLALHEFTAKLINSISGMEPASIIIRAQPSDASIVVDERFSGRGVTEMIDRTPGPVDVVIYAEDYDTVNTTLDLNEGERADISFSLNHIPVGTYNVTVNGKKGSAINDKSDENGSAEDGEKISDDVNNDKKKSAEAEKKSGNKKDDAAVYIGALYSGRTPLELSGSEGSNEAMAVETKSGKTSQIVFEIKDGSSFSLNPKAPPEIGRTEKARKGFYGALGRFWIGLPVAYMIMGFGNSYINTHNYAAASRNDMSHYDDAIRWGDIQTGAAIGLGALGLDVIIRFIIYIYQGNKEGSIFSKKPPSGTSSVDVPKKTDGNIQNSGGH
jgi:hypothetical protein